MATLLAEKEAWGRPSLHHTNPVNWSAILRMDTAKSEMVQYGIGTNEMIQYYNGTVNGIFYLVNLLPYRA